MKDIWILDIPVDPTTGVPYDKSHPLYGWVAVVDETRGGIVAYFGKLEDAETYTEFLLRPREEG